MKTLHEKLVHIQVNLKANKSRKNTFGNYNYRSAEDILEACKPFLSELFVSITVNEELIPYADYPVIKSIASITDGKDVIEASSIVGVDENQKGMQTPQKFGSSSSYAKKYALGNLLLLDDTQDADATNKHDDYERSVIAKIQTIKTIDELLAYYNENASKFSKNIKIVNEFGKMKKILK